MRPTRFRGVIGFGDQKYVERMSNCRIRIADPEAGDLHSRDGQCRPEAHGALPFQAFGEGSNPAGDAIEPGFGRAFSIWGHPAYPVRLRTRTVPLVW